MSKKKKYKRLIIVNVFILSFVVGGFLFFHYLQSEEYDKLKLTFVQIDSEYEIGSDLNGRDFIQYSSTTDIDIPNIISDQEGSQSFIYIVHGKYGVIREFNLVLNFVDTKEILLELTVNEITLQEGTIFNYKDYIKKATVNNKHVEVDVTIPKDIKEVGTHEVVYSITLDSEKKETLIVTVDKKKEVKETDTQPQSNEGQQNTPQPNNETIEQATPVPAPRPTPTPIPSTQPAQFFSSGEYGSIDGAMNACEVVMKKYGGSCIPAERNSDGSWPGYHYAP